MKEQRTVIVVIKDKDPKHCPCGKALSKACFILQAKWRGSVWSGSGNRWLGSTIGRYCSSRCVAKYASGDCTLIEEAERRRRRQEREYDRDPT
jgi:hypothetical protein